MQTNRENAIRRKTFVAATVSFDAEGRITPLRVIWRDGRRFPVDRVLDARPAASLKAGGSGMRFTCRFGRIVTYLFYEDGRWFVEELTPVFPGKEEKTDV